VIAYLDSPVLARAYLIDEDGHEQATRLIGDSQIATVTGTWTRIEVSGALIRAARSSRGDAEGLIALLDADLSADGPVSVVSAPQDQVEDTALGLVRERAIRAMDAWHLAVASLVLPVLAEPGEDLSFASRDELLSRVGDDARLYDGLTVSGVLGAVGVKRARWIRFKGVRDDVRCRKRLVGLRRSRACGDVARRRLGRRGRGPFIGKHALNLNNSPFAEGDNCVGATPTGP
jgi:uncharacterized protein